MIRARNQTSAKDAQRLASWEVNPPMYQRGAYHPRLPPSFFKDFIMAKNNKEINQSQLVTIKPITDSQKTVFNTWKKGQNQFLFGAAGTGKTFISLYLAMQSVMDLKTKYERVIIVRSLIPTREIGFLPGDEEDKSALYQVPYQNMVQFMFEMQNEQQFNTLYDRLKGQGTLFFLSTSFLRGLTFDNSIIIVDECQNMNFHELDTIITRVGQDSRIVFCGDFDQTDLQKTNEKNGLHDFLRILEEMEEFNCTEFSIGDIVRSGFVRNYLINKIKMGLGME